MSKPIQSMVEKRKSRFTNTRSERAMERWLGKPGPEATSGRESCRGSGGSDGGRTGAEDLGRTGDTTRTVSLGPTADDQIVRGRPAHVNFGRGRGEASRASSAGDR